ncbi:reverse transcriptase domain-containing protein [Tanacetum coccineum]
MGYGDYQIGNVTISRVYYIEGLGHNLFSVGQFCDSNLEVAFRQHTCYIRNLEGVALTWWNGHVRSLGHDAAYAMTWEILKKKLTYKYCPKGEIKKLEIELWNLKTEKVDKYISGLPDNIHGNFMSARPKTLDDAIELAKDLMDQKLRTYAKRQAENKRKLDNNNQAQQQLLKKQNVDCWHPINANNQRTIICYECGNQGHYRSDFPVLKNQGTEARGMVYALRGGEANQDLDDMEDDINA